MRRLIVALAVTSLAVGGAPTASFANESFDPNDSPVSQQDTKFGAFDTPEADWSDSDWWRTPGV
jgi:hypothetical protein